MTIKALGDFTNRISEIKPQQTVKLDAAYGGFTASVVKDKRYVMIAGGVGITPIYSICKEVRTHAQLVGVSTSSPGGHYAKGSVGVRFRSTPPHTYAYRTNTGSGPKYGGWSVCITLLGRILFLANKDRQMYHLKSIEVLATELSVDSSNGLSSGEAAKRLQEHGNNILTSKKKIYPWKIFFRQFKNIIVILLVVAAGISFFLGEGVEAIAVLTVILLNALFGFFTEFRAEKSVEALKQMIAKTAKVIRDGTLSEIAAELVVPGDILFLEEGDRVNADARLFKADNLSANEAMLTGESEPVIKNTKIIRVEHVPLAERKNMVFMGTTITHGNGTAVVTGTGSRTEMGKSENGRRENPLRSETG
jgi:magnesium-transporting ATPase (P-type)